MLRILPSVSVNFLSLARCRTLSSVLVPHLPSYPSSPPWCECTKSPNCEGATPIKYVSYQSCHGHGVSWQQEEPKTHTCMYFLCWGLQQAEWDSSQRSGQAQVPSWMGLPVHWGVWGGDIHLGDLLTEFLFSIENYWISFAIFRFSKRSSTPKRSSVFMKCSWHF